MCYIFEGSKVNCSGTVNAMSMINCKKKRVLNSKDHYEVFGFLTLKTTFKEMQNLLLQLCILVHHAQITLHPHSKYSYSVMPLTWLPSKFRKLVANRSASLLVCLSTGNKSIPFNLSGDKNCFCWHKPFLF